MSTDGANATSSICPAGWVLPLSGNASGSNNAVSGSFYNLLSKYNAASGETGAANIIQPPLSFVRNGDVYLSNGNVNSVGSDGYGWSRAASSPTTAYNLSFLSSGVDPLNNRGRYVGLPLRYLYVV